VDEWISKYWDGRYEEFVRVAENAYVGAFVEAIVEKVEVVPYLQPGYKGEDPKWHVGRVLHLNVLSSWRVPLTGRIEVIAHGGILDPKAYPKDAPYRLGCGGSQDLPSAIGQHFLLPIAVDQRYFPELYVFSRAGYVNLDATCKAPGPQAAPFFDTAAIELVEEGKVQFFERVIDFLARYDRFE
jgi:hypothetical protein